MIQGKILENEYINKFPETLNCFIRSCMNNDHEKRICLTPISLSWNKISDIRSRLPEFEFYRNRS